MMGTLNDMLDMIRDADPLATLSRCLITQGVTEEQPHLNATNATR